MLRYVAFLRGINVGGHRVKMDRLREIFEELALAEVSTFIASGNVTFAADADDAEALSERIEQHLAERLGYDVATFLRSPARLEAISAETAPLEEGAPTTSVHVIFLKEPAPKALRAKLANLDSATDEFRFSESEVYWRVEGKLSESPLFARELERAFRGIPTTMRNLNTIRRLVARLTDGGS